MTCSKGLTLLELILVLVILAVLLTVALPGYHGAVIKSNRAVGRLAVMEVVARQERRLQTSKRYGASLEQLGFGEFYFIDGAANIVKAEKAVYQIALVLEEGVYRGVSAIPQNGQRRDLDCGELVYRIPGLRHVTGRFRAAPERCW